ncbi:MAG: hydroxymethylpyrimidine/phosphomethylpyrimidine kinase [Cellvibrionaceae bacterium]|nr:hydroxymethylpyrimidine/phosphomethylpyrimidine kinase [Cellvibrionaceae bacterium]
MKKITLQGGNPPVILAFGALDPSGCGGIQADIETSASLGCHCAPVVTALCMEGGISSAETFAVESAVIIEQARSILEGMNVSAIKVGFLGSNHNIEAVHTILRDFCDIPVVSHPALSLWDSEDCEQQNFSNVFSELILPDTRIANFSLFEARQISREADTLNAVAQAIMSVGPGLALITGTGQETHAFQNSLYSESGLLKNYHWSQEPLSCHGSSSTLATSQAAYLAHGSDEISAIEQALNFTWRAVSASRELGFGKRTPHRFFWADKNIETPSDLPVSPKNH